MTRCEKSIIFSATQILREINFDHFIVLQIAVLPNFKGSNFGQCQL